MRSLLLILLAIAGAFAVAGQADAQCYGPSYGGYSYGHSYGRSYSPSYCGPTYNHCSPSYGCGPRYYNTCSAWVYGAWPQNGDYFYRYQTCYDAYGNATNHNDGWLYCRYWHCGQWCYRRHCLISAYGPSPTLAPTGYVEDRGQTQINYYGPAYDVARSFPQIMQPGMLNQKSLPRAESANAIMPQFVSTREARVDNAHKADMSGREFAKQVYLGEQKLESDQLQLQGQIALARELGQQEERLLAGFAERRAALMGQATYQGDRAAGPGIQFASDKVHEGLGKLLNERCVKCHGASKQAGGLDLRDYASFDPKKWRGIRAKCESGEMPQDGNPLTEDELDQFDQQINKIRGRG